MTHLCHQDLVRFNHAYTTSILKKIYLFCVYEYTIAVFRHIRNGHQIPLQMVVSHHVGTGDWTLVLCKSVSALTAEPALALSVNCQAVSLWPFSVFLFVCFYVSFCFCLFVFFQPRSHFIALNSVCIGFVGFRSSAILLLWPPECWEIGMSHRTWALSSHRVSPRDCAQVI